MLLTALATRVGAHVYRQSAKSLTLSYFFASGASVIVAAAAALAALGGERWEEHAPILMLIPIGYLIAARLYGDRIQAEPSRWVAHAAAIAMLVSSLMSALVGFSRLSQAGALNLSLALFFGEAAVFYALATWMQKQPRLVYLTTLMASGCVWQLLTYLQVGTQGYILVFAVIGLLLLLAYRLSFWEQTAAAPLSEPLFQAANTLLSLAFVSSVFQLKATTIVGGILSVLYFVTLLILVPWSQLNSVAIAITVGGGVIFSFGLILAFFRDRLLALPDRIKQRQGAFRVLNWR